MTASCARGDCDTPGCVAVLSVSDEKMVYGLLLCPENHQVAIGELVPDDGEIISNATVTWSSRICMLESISKSSQSG